MTGEPKLTGPARACVILILLTLTGAILSLAEKVLVPVVLAVLFSFMLTPLVTMLQRLGMRRAPAALLVVIMAILGVGAVGYVVSGQLQSLAQELPQHKNTIRDKVSSLPGMGDGLLDDLLNMIQEIKEEVTQDKGAANARLPEQPVAVVIRSEQPSGFLYSFSTIVGPVLEGLASTALIIVMVLFILVAREDLRARLLRLLGRGRITHTTKALDDGSRRISRFLFMQFVINGVFGLLIAAGLHLTGLPYAMLWGFLAALLRFIPYLGTWIALLLPFTYSIAVFPGWTLPLAVAGYFVALDLLAAYFVEPVLFGHSVGVSPFALLVAATFWTWLWGPVGLLLSTPLTSCLVVLGKHVPQLEFLDILLGDEQVLESRVSFYQRLLARDVDEATNVVEDFLECHSVEEAIDDIFLPTLVFVRKDLASGDLPVEDERFILQTLRDMVDDLPIDASAVPEELADKVVVFGCPVSDEVDETALRFLGKLLERSLGRFQILSPTLLSAEVVARVRQEKQAIVCLATLPPGGLAQTRYLCKRLRAQVPQVRIVVGEWGSREQPAVSGARLLAAGADQVTYAIRETKIQVLALLPVVSEQQRRSDGRGRPLVATSGR